MTYCTYVHSDLDLCHRVGKEDTQRPKGGVTFVRSMRAGLVGPGYHSPVISGQSKILAGGSALPAYG